MELLFELLYIIELCEGGIAALGIRLGGYQPHYFPRLHCVARMLHSDISPIADYVQYVRKHAYPAPNGERASGPSYQAHTPIKTRNGIVLLGVPVVHAGRKQRINEARVSYEALWPEKHLNMIEEQYRSTRNFGALFPELQSLLRQRRETLSDLSVATLTWSLATLFEISPASSLTEIESVLPRTDVRLRSLVLVSQTSVAPPNKDAGRDANDWIIDMCKHFGADEYYFGGTSAACYMDFERFQKAGITLTQQAWQCREYPQPHGPFAPNLSILDLLMNTEPHEARAMLHA